MFVKITTIVLMAIIATSKGKNVWDGYSAIWAEDPADGFLELPQDIRDAESQGWTEISGARAPHNSRGLGYYGDPRVVIFFSKCTGKPIGHQVGFLVSDIVNSGNPINYTANPAITVKTLNGKKYFTGTVLYRKDERKNTRQIWLEVDGKFVEIPTKPELITRKTSYYSKKCVTWMGHHFYQISSNTSCSDIFPWVPLEVEGEIIGIVFQAIGNSSTAPKRKWFETLPPGQLAYTIPDAPSCIGEGLQKYGLISFHVWLKKKPLDIICKDECTAVYNSTSYSGREQPEYHVRPSKRYKRALGPANICPV